MQMYAKEIAFWEVIVRKLVRKFVLFGNNIKIEEEIEFQRFKPQSS